ncbi:MAG TPA: nickel-dependent lactate racemase [Candidatus Avacidaminococcus intestinavium]|uniref:Nickel-dependent lactate racemase n=1 Tax=Candidatus Avacidaminococcus intestinavium TaxID=2840684 RepID=A0A9D1SL28_9FIRM|nr:nickel-dependent lactate racemase [Candidatus Avacidaminococcus intestinavium]
MTCKKYSYHYGHGHKEFTLDEGKVLKEVRMPDLPPITDIKAAVLEAVSNPIGRPPLQEIVKPGQTVAFICNDPTRVANSFDFMPVLVNELNRLGVKDEDMRIVFALGTHRTMSAEEMVEAVGTEVASRIKMYNSDAMIADDFAYFGDTSRGTPVWINKLICDVDHVILTGTIVHHFFAGYGGGRKAILPGVSAYETIRVNHSFMLDEHAGLGKLHGNPVYEDQMEGVELFAKGRSLFLFNAVLDEEHRFLAMFAGDYDKAHLEACQFVDAAYGVPIPEAADVVIASCGGYPKDINVYQMQKTMDNAWCAVKEGGVVILLAECAEGSGSAQLEETCKKNASPDLIKAELEKNFVIGAHKAFAVTRLMKKAKFILVSELDEQIAKSLFFTDVVDNVEAALVQAEQLVGKDYKVILMPTGSLTVPIIKD